MTMQTKLLITAIEAAEALSISRTKLYEGVSSGVIGPQGIKIGGKRLFDPNELAAGVKAGCPPRVHWIKQKI